MAVHEFIQLPRADPGHTRRIIDFAVALLEKLAEVVSFNRFDTLLACLRQGRKRGVSRCFDSGIIFKKLTGKAVYRQHGGRFQNVGSFNQVFQFANISRPIVALECLDHLRIDIMDFLGLEFIEPVQN